jgi:hypothetical protein
MVDMVKAPCQVSSVKNQQGPWPLPATEIIPTAGCSRALFKKSGVLLHSLQSLFSPSSPSLFPPLPLNPEPWSWGDAWTLGRAEAPNRASDRWGGCHFV